MLKNLIKWHAQSHRFGSRYLFLAAQIYKDYYASSSNYQPNENGEFRLLEKISHLGFHTVFDVGANDGSYSLMASKLLRHSKIYAFELSPVTFKELQKNTCHISSIIPVDVGLSDNDQSVNFYHVDDNPELSGLSERPYSVQSRLLEARTQTIDSFCRQMSIKSVDFLKIDVEGFEREVLKGAATTISNTTIIQFEYNEMSWRRGIFLDELLSYLPGFHIGRITQGGVI
jgi:FkbM family methyltransferase